MVQNHVMNVMNVGCNRIYLVRRVSFRGCDQSCAPEQMQLAEVQMDLHSRNMKEAIDYVNIQNLEKIYHLFCLHE